MRLDTPEFAAANQAPAKQLRIVSRIVFDVASIYITSDPDMVNVSGDNLLGHLQGASAVSQEIFPDEGRATIGSMSFSVVDLGSDLTDSLRNQLQAEFQNLRGRTVQMRIGYSSDYDEGILLVTQTVRGCEFDDGVYRITCNDIQREQRQQIFEALITNLSASVSATTTTIPVLSTAGFQAINHDNYYADAPNSTVGYFRLEDEIIRWTGKTDTSLTGCTRGVFNTVATVHEIEENAAADRQPKIEEVIYLEGPGPKLALAVMTGVYNNGTLPEHWHMGINPAQIT